MVDQNKWGIPGWGAAHGQIRDAVHFLCEGKGRADREEIAEEIVATVRAIAKGEPPAAEASPYDREGHAREGWARSVANHLVDGALMASERSGGRLPNPDQVSLLREIAKRALWHMPNSETEARKLARIMVIENLKQPHPDDDPPSRE
jgi:hypothetical protein